MAYGTVKVDNITFTNDGIDQTVTVSGIVQSISGNITATGTIQGQAIIGTSTVSGATVTGDAGQFTTATAATGIFTTITGGTATLTSGVFASGTAAAPSVSIGTTDNGLYSPGTDQVAVATNGAQRITVDSSGRLLVGTSSSTDSAFLIVQGNTAGSTGAGVINIAVGTATPADGGALGVVRFSDSGHSESVSIVARRDAGTWTSGSSMPTRLEFYTAADGASTPTERMRITSDGYVRLASGTGGIQFNGDTAAANALDDYEEGTWTPGQGTFTTWTSPTFNATYTKIGRLVQVNLRQTGGTIGWSATQFMTGLPYTPAESGSAYATDTTPNSDNGPLLIWTTGSIYFQVANAAENALVFSATYHT